MGSSNTRNAILAGIFLVLCMTMVFIASIGRDITDSLDQGNKIECIKLRESGADSVGKIDREACPYDMGGQS